MKNAAIALAVLTLTLAACAGKTDVPTEEQVAKAYEMHMNANLVSELGQRIEIRGWDDLKVEADEDALLHIATYAEGDARRALNALSAVILNAERKIANLRN